MAKTSISAQMFDEFMQKGQAEADRFVEKSDEYKDFPPEVKEFAKRAMAIGYGLLLDNLFTSLGAKL